MSDLAPPPIAEDSPLRLDVAARLAFPDGSMTESGLRREIAKGTLEVERIAGRFYVTLGGIKRMRERCRVRQKEPVSTSDASSEPGTSVTASSNVALDALLMTGRELKERLKRTSRKNTRRTSAEVIQIGSRS